MRDFRTRSSVEIDLEKFFLHVLIEIDCGKINIHARGVYLLTNVNGNIGYKHAFGDYYTSKLRKQGFYFSKFGERPILANPALLCTSS